MARGIRLSGHPRLILVNGGNGVPVQYRLRFLEQADRLKSAAT